MNDSECLGQRTPRRLVSAWSCPDAASTTSAALVGALHSGFIRGALKRRQRSGGSSLAKQTDREPTATDTATMLGLAVSMALDCVYFGVMEFVIWFLFWGESNLAN